MPTNRNAAGDLPEGDTDLKGSVTIKTGARELYPRGGKTLEFRFKASEGFRVLQVRIEELARAADEELPENFEIYFKHSKQATQPNYVKLEAEDFLDRLKARWARMTELDLERWSAENVEPIDGMVFELFVYKPQTTRTTIRRATVESIRREEARIADYIRNNNLQYTKQQSTNWTNSESFDGDTVCQEARRHTHRNY